MSSEKFDLYSSSLSERVYYTWLTTKDRDQDRAVKPWHCLVFMIEIVLPLLNSMRHFLVPST